VPKNKIRKSLMVLLDICGCTKEQNLVDLVMKPLPDKACCILIRESDSFAKMARFLDKYAEHNMKIFDDWTRNVDKLH